MRKLTSFSLILLTLLALSLPNGFYSPALVLAQSSVCAKIGVNSAFFFDQQPKFYQKATSHQMGWTLEIADSANPAKTIAGIKAAHSKGLTPIIRIGLGLESNGFADPTAYLTFLNSVASQVSQQFFAVVGPNEPDAEHWLGDYDLGSEPEPREGLSEPQKTQFALAGKLLADYLNHFVRNRSKLDPKVKLLSPSINITSWSGHYLFSYMLDQGANLGQLDGLTGTAYNTFDRPDGRLTSHVQRLLQNEPRLDGSKFYLTEIGAAEVLSATPRPKAIQNLAEEVDKIKKGTLNIQAALLFNAFNTSPDTAWRPFALSDSELSIVLGPGCASVSHPVERAPGPLEAGFKPLEKDCDQTYDPEYHPLRPYPGNPCDPLIPRSLPEAPKTKEQKFNTFACGNSLTPVVNEPFEPYGRWKRHGDDRQVSDPFYQNLNPFDNKNHQYTWCDKEESQLDPNGGTINCYRTEYFDITVDLKHANLGIISNTQNTELEDAQKVNNYLAWYLNGSPQIGDQLPVDAKTPQGQDRLINYTGPIRKLLPYDLQRNTNTAIIDSAKDEVHDYIVGCSSLNTDFPKQFVSIVLSFLGSVASTNIAAIAKIAAIAGPQVYELILHFGADGMRILGNALQAVGFALNTGVTDPGRLHSIGMEAISLSDPAIQTAVGNILTTILSASLDNISAFLTAITQILRLQGTVVLDCRDKGLLGKQFRLTDYNEDNLISYIPVAAQVQHALLQRLIQNLPLSSLEDIPGEITLSVFRDPTADQQHPDVADKPDGINDTAPLELQIKKAELAKP